MLVSIMDWVFGPPMEYQEDNKSDVNRLKTYRCANKWCAMKTVSISNPQECPRCGDTMWVDVDLSDVPSVMAAQKSRVPFDEMPLDEFEQGVHKMLDQLDEFLRKESSE